MVKNLITTTQVNFAPRPRIFVFKIFTINLPSQPFLGSHLGFHIFFHNSLFEGRTLFLQLGCFGLDFISFCICIPQSRPYLTYPFSLPQEEEKDEEDFEYFNFISKYTNYIYLIHIFILHINSDNLFAAVLSTG